MTHDSSCKADAGSQFYTVKLSVMVQITRKTPHEWCHAKQGFGLYTVKPFEESIHGLDSVKMSDILAWLSSLGPSAFELPP